MIKYIKNPNLPTINPDFQGNQILENRFLNYQSGTRPSIRDILRWQFTFKLQRYKNKYSRYKPQIQHNQNLFDNTQDKIVWLGHASFLITLNGKNILIDPVFKNIPLIKRRIKMPFAIDRCTPIDYVLISHAHFDHLDKFSLMQICQQNPDVQIFCGLGTEETIRGWGIQNVITEAGWWQKLPTDDGLEIYFLPAQHWSNRSLKDRNTRLWGSFIIGNAQSCIYFMGDSAYAEHFAEIANFFPNIDYAIMGVGAYNPSFIMQSSHLNPNEAYQAFLDTGSKHMIPMHYGTFILADEPIDEPIQRTRQLFVTAPASLCELGIGEELQLIKR